MTFADGPEVPLLGGDVTEGVVRVGDTVRRPRGPEAPLVESVLRHLEQFGFGGAPRFHGIDGRGRQVLSYVAGEVATRPWPAWVAEEQRSTGVARLLRAYDDTVIGLGVPASVVRRPDPPGTPPALEPARTFIGHQDVTPENVVFVDGEAAALIDFDLARPTDRVGEVCNLLLWWAPLQPITDRQPVLRDVDAMRRAALLVDAYGLDDQQRQRIVAVARNSAARSWFLMRDRAERLGGGWRRMWDSGIGDQILRRQRWLAEHDKILHAAVTSR